MKKLSFLLIFIMIAVCSYGQRRQVTSAWNFLRDGFLEDAKEAIDRAAEHPDTENSYRMFRYRGQIYQELAITQEPRYKNICDETCLDIALESYIKALQLNFSDPENQNIDFTDEVDLMRFFQLIQNQDTRYEDTQLLMDVLMVRFPALSNAFINRGVDKFQEKLDFEGALADFEQAMLISTLSLQVDTQLVYFASLAAFRAEDYSKAIDYNKALIDMEFGETDEEKVNLYQTLAMSYQLKEDYDNMIETLQKGIEKFPEHSYPLIIETFNHYVNTSQTDEAYKYISMAIEKNPDDPQFYVIKGALLEELGRRDEAIDEYRTAANLDEGNFDANYSLGAFYYNTAVDTLTWADENIVITDFARHDEIRDIANKYFEKSLPYLSNALNIDEDNMNVLNTLRVVYYRLNKMEEYEEIQARINKLSEARQEAVQEQVEEE